MYTQTTYNVKNVPIPHTLQIYANSKQRPKSDRQLDYLKLDMAKRLKCRLDHITLTRKYHDKGFAKPQAFAKFDDDRINLMGLEAAYAKPYLFGHRIRFIPNDYRAEEINPDPKKRKIFVCENNLSPMHVDLIIDDFAKDYKTIKQLQDEAKKTLVKPQQNEPQSKGKQNTKQNQNSNVAKAQNSNANTKRNKKQNRNQNNKQNQNKRQTTTNIQNQPNHQNHNKPPIIDTGNKPPDPNKVSNTDPKENPKAETDEDDDLNVSFKLPLPAKQGKARNNRKRSRGKLDASANSYDDDVVDANSPKKKKKRTVNEASRNQANKQVADFGMLGAVEALLSKAKIFENVPSMVNLPTFDNDKQEKQKVANNVAPEPPANGSDQINPDQQ